jgi:hypothetical protein
MNKLNLQLGVLVGIVLVAAVFRLFPLYNNISPIGAIALFGAAHFTKKWQAIAIPLVATWLSDLYLNNVVYTAYYPNFTWFESNLAWTYTAYLIIGLGAFTYFKNTISTSKVFNAAVGSGLVFFLVSNFGVWYSGSMYAKTFAGLMACYTAGLPFLKGTMLGNVLFGAVLFGAYFLLQKGFTALKITGKQYA